MKAWILNKIKYLNNSNSKIPDVNQKNMPDASNNESHNMELKLENINLDSHSNKNNIYKVILCGICKTDAKICTTGHRDLTLPRIPGHEICVEDENGQTYAVWPGNACGKCLLCKQNLENLCKKMQITGFHNDGGFSPFIQLNKNSLVKIPENIPISSAVFAEPLACAVNAIEQLSGNLSNKSIVIIGGGVCGLLTALAANFYGLKTTIIENSSEKQNKIKKALSYINCQLNSSNKDSFDFAINATSNINALLSSMEYLKPSGTLIFFSGITNSTTISAKLFNEIHYRQLTIKGAYGCRKNNIKQAINIMENNNDFFSSITEKYIKHKDVKENIYKVLTGKYLRFIIDYRL
jgi:nicotinate-nucleotide--dimethylbenzimidazole phosphoribosyltransferase